MRFRAGKKDAGRQSRGEELAGMESRQAAWWPAAGARVKEAAGQASSLATWHGRLPLEGKTGLARDGGLLSLASHAV